MEQNKTIGGKQYSVVFRADNGNDRTVLKTLGKMWVSGSTNINNRILRLCYSDDYAYMDFEQAVRQALNAAGPGQFIVKSRYAGSEHIVHLQFDYAGNAKWAEATFRAVSSIGSGIDSVAYFTTDESYREVGGYVCCEIQDSDAGRWMCVWVPFDEVSYQQEQHEAAEERHAAAELNRNASQLNVESQRNNNEVAELKVDESAFNLVSGTTTTVTYVIIAMVIVAALTGLFFMFK